MPYFRSGMSRSMRDDLRKSVPVYGSGTANRYVKAKNAGDNDEAKRLKEELVSMVGSGRADMLIKEAESKQ